MRSKWLTGPATATPWGTRRAASALLQRQNKKIKKFTEGQQRSTEVSWAGTKSKSPITVRMKTSGKRRRRKWFVEQEDTNEDKWDAEHFFIFFLTMDEIKWYERSGRRCWWNWPVPIRWEQKVNWISDREQEEMDGMGGRTLAGTPTNRQAWQGRKTLPRRAKPRHKTLFKEKKKELIWFKTWDPSKSKVAFLSS